MLHFKKHHLIAARSKNNFFVGTLQEDNNNNNNIFHLNTVGFKANIAYGAVHPRRLRGR